MEECESLGLFATRMPRFSQVFFYDFSDREVRDNLGQGPTASLRAAEAYLSSGVRLESTCGISDIWYHYVEDFQHKLRSQPAPSPPPAHFAPHPYIDPTHTSCMRIFFNWEFQHYKRQPRKKIPANNPSAITGSPARVGNGRDGQADRSKDEANSKPYSAPPLVENTSEHGEHEGNGLGETLPKEQGERQVVKTAKQAVGLEEGGRGKGAEGLEASGAGGEAVGGMVGKEESGLSDWGFEEWPATSSFVAALAKTMDEAEKTEKAALIVADGFVPSSVPEEQELRLDPGPAHTTRASARASPGARLEDPIEISDDEAEGAGGVAPIEVSDDEVEGAGEEDRMEGIEASQPTLAQVYADSAGVLCGEGAADGDGGAMEGVEASQPTSTGSHTASRGQRVEAEGGEAGGERAAGEDGAAMEGVEASQPTPAEAHETSCGESVADEGEETSGEITEGEDEDTMETEGVEYTRDSE
jgi:hypothetical protein